MLKVETPLTKNDGNQTINLIQILKIFAGIFIISLIDSKRIVKVNLSYGAVSNYGYNGLLKKMNRLFYTLTSGIIDLQSIYDISVIHSFCKCKVNDLGLPEKLYSQIANNSDLQVANNKLLALTFA